jgi:hypothetical protein
VATEGMNHKPTHLIPQLGLKFEPERLTLRGQLYKIL